MNRVVMPAELDAPKQQWGLLFLVLLGHMLLLSALSLQKTVQSPKPLAIELSLSAPEPQQQAPRPASKQINTPRPEPASKPNAQAALPAPITTPAQMPTPIQTPTPVPVPAVPAMAATSNQNVTAPVTKAAPTVLPNADAAYLSNPKPGYPPLSKRLGEQGVVLLNVFVGEGGDVQKLEVAKSSGHSRLDETASRAVQAWKFAPGTQAGIAQAMWVKVPISFILEK